jgi:hypothetical protein
VPVIRKGTDFGDDLTDALSEVGILWLTRAVAPMA